MKKRFWYILPVMLTVSLGIGALTACGEIGEESESKTYTLVYDLDGGTGTRPEGGSHAEGDKFSVASGTGLSKTEYLFDGWLDGTTKVQAGSEYTMPARDVTLKADWKAVTYNVTYSLGDHAAQDAAVPAQEPVASGTVLELPTPNTAKGWTFSGWDLGSKSVPFIEGKSQYTVNADDAAEGTIAFEATYTAKEYNVHFEKGRVGDVSVENWPELTGTVSLESGFDTVRFLDAPVCDGWDFKGWSLNGEDLGTTLDFTLAEEYLPNDDSANIIITAEWKKSFVVSVTAGKETINVNMTGEDEALENGATLVSMKTFEYYEGDVNHGMSEHYSKGTTVGEYESSDAGEDVDFKVTRFGEDKRDRLYDKYYLVKDGKLLKGPYYVSKVTEPMEEGTKAPEYMSKITTRKGVLAENETFVDDLGAQHARWDFNLNSFYYPDATAESEDALPFELNGKTFYFKKGAVDGFDDLVSKYSKKNMDIIVVVYINGNQVMPYDLTYQEFGAWDSSIGVNPIAGFNTSNENGLEWWAATMEFFAQRYSGGKDSVGYVSTYVVGNEVDFEGDYFRIAREHQPIDTFVEEYGRCLRIADLAVKKYNPDIQVTTTLTHSWVEPGNTSNFNDRNYSPKELLEKLNAKSKREGDFNWGIAPHPYCYSLPATRMLEYDTDEGYYKYGMTGDVETSSFLTYSNFEILEQFLEREENLFEGKVRDVFLTESGVSSSGYYGFGAGKKNMDDDDLSQSIQAAMVAYTWYKASQLDCVKVYAYYRMYDHPNEGENFTPGLIKHDGTKKKSYEVWKYIDTERSFEYSMKYIQYITCYDVSQKEKKYMTYLNGFDSYIDLLDIFGTGYDFSNFDYQKAMPVRSEEALKPSEYQP